MTRYKNEDKYKKAIKEYTENKGISTSALAEKYNVDVGSLRRYFKQNGIEIKKNVHFEIDDPRYIEGLRLYTEEKIPMYKVAEQLKISVKSFSAYLKKKNVNMRFTYKRPNVTFNKNFFKEIETEKQAYWLGFIMADGNVYKNRLSIELSSVDEEHLNKFIHDISASNLEVKHRKNRKTSIVSIVSKELVEDLFKLGVVYNKTENAFMPEIKVDLIPSFIRGYFDGNGYITKNVKKIQAVIVVGSSILAESMNQILSNFEFKIDDYSTYKKLVLYKKNLTLSFYDYLYSNANIFLDRKMNRYLLLKRALSDENTNKSE